MNKKRKTVLLGIALILGILLVVAAIPMTRSLVIMWIYSEYNERESLLAEKSIELKIPGGGDWYPYVMTFCDNQGFSAWMDEELKLTILYNIPEYDWKQGASVIYDPESEYYSSFYGAYLVERDNGNPYGYDQEGNCVLEEIAEVPKFDFWRLVLEDLGMPKEERCFSWKVSEVQEDVEYVGYGGWTRIEADLIVNGMYHEPDRYVMSYLQYGKPGIRRDVEEYEPVAMKGLLYGKYIPEENVSIFFYCIARNDAIIEECDRTLLSQSSLKMVDFSK